MALLDPIFKISEICSSWGVEEAVIAPGSRSAALSIAFARNPKVNTRIITDERSAGFVALGIAQITQKPAVLICTSGTAALNFAPAVAEAFFQKVPLLILTADRPPEWIHQYDGQTIFQSGIYGRHIVKSYDFPVDYTHPDAVWQIQRDTHEALAYTKTGPVHINIPIREPFYPEEGEIFNGGFRDVEYSFGSKSLSENIWDNLIEQWNNVEDIAIAIGQNHANLDPFLTKLSQGKNVTIWSDIISNVNLDSRISTQDLFLSKAENRKTDLLITLGKSFISKSFKLYFRNNKALNHWQVGDDPEMIDSLQSITHKLVVDDTYFLSELSGRVSLKESDEKMYWRNKEKETQTALKSFLDKCEWGELKATFTILQYLQTGDVLDLGNSMPVRYANYLQCFLPDGIMVYANRGTSGIDGVVSTAIGHACRSDGKVHCIVGDVSFFYDSNALFAQKTDSFNVYVMNNGGGNIFRVIDGPGRQPELESHFLTNTGRNAKNLAEDAGFNYYQINSESDLIFALTQAKEKSAVFEIFLDGESDAEILRKLKKSIL